MEDGTKEAGQQRHWGRHYQSNKRAESYHLIITNFYDLPFFIVAGSYRAEFQENVLIDMFLLLQKMYLFLYFENLYAEEESGVRDAGEPIVVWDGTFCFRD